MKQEYQTYGNFRDQEHDQLYLSTGGASGAVPHRIAPDNITELKKNEYFVFGSNEQGYHGGGAARFAMEHFGAEWGKGEGITGCTYAIPTMEGLINTAAAINRFIDYAGCHPDDTFLVTPIGCGIAGYSPLQIAPLFAKAVALPNIFMPKIFWEYFWMTSGVCPESFEPGRVWMEYEHNM